MSKYKTTAIKKKFPFTQEGKYYWTPGGSHKSLIK